MKKGMIGIRGGGVRFLYDLMNAWEQTAEKERAIPAIFRLSL
jgi:hypothetical protein